jgi:hypothetical protein
MYIYNISYILPILHIIVFVHNFTLLHDSGLIQAIALHSIWCSMVLIKCSCRPQLITCWNILTHFFMQSGLILEKATI